MKEKKDAVLLLRLSKALLAAIDRAAEKDDRERSDWIRKTLKKAAGKCLARAKVLAIVEEVLDEQASRR